jgi:hypothetical protein
MLATIPQQLPLGWDEQRRVLHLRESDSVIECYGTMRTTGQLLRTSLSVVKLARMIGYSRKILDHRRRHLLSAPIERRTGLAIYDTAITAIRTHSSIQKCVARFRSRAVDGNKAPNIFSKPGELRACTQSLTPSHQLSPTRSSARETDTC